jgi:putative protease
VGESIHIVGHTTDVTQAVDSMQIENKSVQEAGPGADIGIKIKDRVREHDAVYKVAG